MGSIISLDIISVNFLFAPTPEKPTLWPIYALLIIIALMIFCGFFFLCLKLKPAMPKPGKIKIPSIFILIAFLLLVSIPLIEGGYRSPSFSPYKPKSSRKFTKPMGKVAKFTAPLMASTLFYFGLDQLAQMVIDEPELATFVFAVFGCFFILFLLLILKLASIFYKKFRNEISPVSPLSNSVEMAELQNQVQELVNRSNPPRI